MLTQRVLLPVTADSRGGWIKDADLMQHLALNNPHSTINPSNQHHPMMLLVPEERWAAENISNDCRVHQSGKRFRVKVKKSRRFPFKVASARCQICLYLVRFWQEVFSLWVLFWTFVCCWCCKQAEVQLKGLKDQKNAPKMEESSKMNDNSLQISLCRKCLQHFTLWPPTNRHEA